MYVWFPDHDWFWHSMLPKQISICMWKGWFKCFAVDERVQSKGMSLASACDCCARRSIENMDHILSSGDVASEVWNYVSSMLGVPCLRHWTWKTRVSTWFYYAKKSSITGILIGLIPCLITWCLWKRRCKVRMEGKQENANQVWQAVRVWINLLGNKIVSVPKLFVHDRKILEEFRLKCPSTCKRPEKIVTRSRPPTGWMKINCDGSCGNPRTWGGGSIIQDSNGVVLGAFSTHYGYGTNNGAELKAILEGIRWCKRLQVVNVFIESDSQIVVDWIRKGRHTLWYLWVFWEELCKELEGMNFVVAHQYREANCAANFLAREGEMGRNAIYASHSTDFKKALFILTCWGFLLFADNLFYVCLVCL